MLGAGVGGEDAACVSINRVANLDREGDRPTGNSFSALFDQIKSAISAGRSASFYQTAGLNTFCLAT